MRSTLPLAGAGAGGASHGGRSVRRRSHGSGKFNGWIFIRSALRHSNDHMQHLLPEFFGKANDLMRFALQGGSHFFWNKQKLARSASTVWAGLSTFEEFESSPDPLVLRSGYFVTVSQRSSLSSSGVWPRFSSPRSGKVAAR